jgi:PAS domain S-box-containing protein
MNQTAPQTEPAPAYRTLFNLINQAVFVASGETGMIRDANPAAEALTGRSLGELKTMHHSRLHPSDEEEEARRLVNRPVPMPASWRVEKMDL